MIPLTSMIITRRRDKVRRDIMIRKQKIGNINMALISTTKSTNTGARKADTKKAKSMDLKSPTKVNMESFLLCNFKKNLVILSVLFLSSKI